MRKWLLSRKPGGVVVTNLSTSRMLDDIAAQTDARVVRTPVGEANVIDAMLREHAIIGGEGNGGVIDPRIVPGRDSLVGMAYVLQLMAATGRRSRSSWRKFRTTRSSKRSSSAAARTPNRAVEALKKEFANEKIDTQDGIRIDWDRAWVHARPSNTEPIMRIIAEAPDRATADKRMAQVQSIVHKTLASA